MVEYVIQLPATPANLRFAESLNSVIPGAATIVALPGTERCPPLDETKDILTAIESQRLALEQDVENKKQAWAEAEERLSAFRANALSALGAASGSKSAQKQRAERQAVVAQLLAEGLSRAEIVRRTGLVDHLVGYDIDCIRRRRKKQGTTKTYATGAHTAEPAGEPPEGPAAEAPIPASSAPSSPPPPSVHLQSSPHQEDEDSGEDSEATDDEDGVDFGATLKALTIECAKRCALSEGVVLFYTTTDDGHRHLAGLSKDGYGRTREVDGHTHAVNMFDVRDVEGHTHGLTLEPVSEIAAPASTTKAVGAKAASPVPNSSVVPGQPGVVRPGCAVGRDRLKAAMKDHQRGKRKTRTFRTTVDNGHSHVATLDGMGDGETAKKDGTGHFHRVVRYELIEGSHDHTHGLTLEEGVEKDGLKT